MAEATVTQAVTSVTLTLTLSEAMMLHDVLRRVGGDVRASRRREADEVLRSLEYLNLHKANYDGERDLIGDLEFK